MAVTTVGLPADPAVLLGETERWQRMPALRGREFLAGRALARRLATASGSPWVGLEVVSERWKPRPVAGGYDVSIAHDGRFVAAAMATTGRVGIDVVDAERALAVGIARRLCTPAESRALPTGPAGLPRLRELLAVKEAYAKALGVGLALGFDGVAAEEIERLPGVTVISRRTAEMELCAVHIEDAA
ncbi:4'-phosphopantetheinyl transferase superfamily protein [Microbacteriaceae bacterium VKM Ac-2855]|nr:4'-phosphopantetheinyl transferase superfamily protein [Microbacteriaceae bacterium VKM Ac-2855]